MLDGIFRGFSSEFMRFFFYSEEEYLNEEKYYDEADSLHIPHNITKVCDQECDGPVAEILLHSRAIGWHEHFGDHWW